jgi:hypothetical protein
MICGWEGVVLLLASLRAVVWQSQTVQSNTVTFLWYRLPLRRHFLFPQKKVTKRNLAQRSHEHH